MSELSSHLFRGPIWVATHTLRSPASTDTETTHQLLLHLVILIQKRYIVGENGDCKRHQATEVSRKL